MARRIRFPFLIDVTLVDGPAEIRALADEGRLDRDFQARGPLLNRLITWRIRRWFRVRGAPLPALAPRGDQQRAERQRSLHAELRPVAGVPLWTDGQLGRLADYVQGRADRKSVGIAVQEIVGRRFDPAYLADEASWQAATTIDAYRDASLRTLLRDLWWVVSGRLARAHALLAQRAGEDRHALHGTAIGVHGIVAALDRMQALYTMTAPGSIDATTAVARSLRGPSRVPRSVEELLVAPVPGPSEPPTARSSS
jgi:hypothetical protein